MEFSSIPIAIIGIGCRLPGGVGDTESLWNLLAEGRNTWSPVPPDRFNEKSFYHPNPENNGTTNHRGGHFLSQDNNVAAFDAGLFGMSAAEAQATDPQQRLLLEVSYEAFENAGIPVEQIQGSDTAVYAAMFTRDYDGNIYKDPMEIPKYHTTGCGDAIMSNRISHFFHLMGPSMTLDTGCSGSIVALHQACQSLRAGESSAALVCGVSLILNPDQMIGMSNLHMLNNDGKSYAFDARGAGYGRGEGITAVMLKRLDDALEAGDNIRAVIRSTAVNHDGRTNGITSPSYKAQEALQKKAFQQAGLNPCTIQYVEAHGTGTAAGDTAELRGIAQTFGKNRAPSDPIWVGSIKSNLGHLESSSGLAGLIKTVLMLERGYILPNADFQKPKPELKLDEWNIRIPQKFEPWPTLQRASVNSFGYGGVNTHAILECAPAQGASLYHDRKALENENCAHGGNSLKGARSEIPDHEAAPRAHDSASVLCSLSCREMEPSVVLNPSNNRMQDVSRSGSSSEQMPKSTTKRLFVITASGRENVLQIVRNLHSWASAQSEAKLDLDSLAYTLATRRSMLQWRYAIQASSREEFLLRLDERLASTKSSKAPKILFVFTGQGAQWHAMGRELNLKYPSFRESLLRSEEILRDLGAPWALTSELGRDEKDSRIHQSEIAQPSSTALQIALVDLLESFGVMPATVIGHSSGEIAAAYAAGAISHRTALKVSFHRSLLSAICKQRISCKGAMLSVGLGECQISPLLSEARKGVVSLACINSPSSTTVSGDEPAIADLQDRLNDMGIFNRKLKVDTAYHSHHMRRVAENYSHSLKSLKTSAIAEKVTFISSVSGLQKNEGFGSDYWVENLVSKVLFSDAMDEYCRLELASSGNRYTQHLIIELGPHGALAGPIQQNITEVANSLVRTYSSVLTRGQDAVHSILSLSGRLFEHGYPIDLQAANCLFKSNSRLRVLKNLPLYPWDHSTQYWHESRLSKEYRMRPYPCHDLLGIKITSSPSLAPSWRYILSLDRLPWLADHVIDGLVTFPGAGYVCMAIEASKQLADGTKFEVESFVLRNVSFMKALVIPAAPKSIELQICFRPQELGQMLGNEFRVYALSQDKVWHEHCRGRIFANPASCSRLEDCQSSQPEFHEVDQRGSHKMSANDVYSRLQANGNRYGPCFARIKELHISDLQVIACITIPDIQSTMHAEYQQPHIIHPTTLDALLHTAVPLYERRYGSGSVLPVIIEELSISRQISNTPGDNLLATAELFPQDRRSAFANLSVHGGGNPVKEQPPLTVSNLQLLGLGDLEQSPLTSSDSRNVAYQLQWIPEMASEAQKGFEVDLKLRTRASHKNDRLPLNSSRNTKSSPRRGSEVVGGSGQMEHQIELIAAHRCQEFATVLTSVLHEDGHKVSATTWASRATKPQAIYVILDDSKQPFLENPATALFRDIIERTDSVSNVLWVSAQVGVIDPKSSKDPKSALVTGFARSARAEREQLKITTLHLSANIEKDLPAVSRAVAEIIKRSINNRDEMEYIYRDSRFLIPRLVPDAPINKCMAQTGKPRLEEALYLRSKGPLQLDLPSVQRPSGVCFVDGPTASGSPKPDEVEVEAWAQSPDLTHFSRTERRNIDPIPTVRGFAGTLRAIGSKAQNMVEVGDTVIGWNLQSSAYLNHPCTKLCNITRIPRHWSFSVAAAMIVPLMAGYYSLVEVTKLREGQSILIHGAVGLGGQITIEMAKRTGAKVLVTVSTFAQQEDLATRFNLPPSSFLFHRGMRLEREVLKRTAGKGVDVVLTMPCEGPAPDLGGCVAALGMYLQTLRAGEKVDVTPPRLTRSAITYVSIDLNTIAQYRPEKLAHSLEKGVSVLSDEFSPFANVKCIPVSQIEDTPAELQKSTAPEEIVVTANADTKVKVRRGVQADLRRGIGNLRSDATYIIAGGLGNLGQEASIVMAKSGAKHVVLLSRRSMTSAKADSLQESLRQWSPGAKLYVMQCDISERTAVLTLAKKLETLGLPAVRGVLQSATVLQDRVLEKMNVEDWQVPLRTKTCGTRNLDEAFGSLSLDFFVMLSSLSGVVGSRGQANYAAGNTYQDAFAHCRIDSQTAYIALDLGMIEYSSVYNDTAGHVRVQNLLRQGWIPIKKDQLIAIFEWVLSPDAWCRGSGQYTIGIDGASIFEAENATPTTKSAMFTHVRGTCKVKGPMRLAPSLGYEASITAVDTLEEARKVISKATSQKVSSLVSVGNEDIEEDKPLQDYGLDSLSAIEVKNFIRKKFGANVNASEILDEPCLAALSRKVASRSELLREKFGNSPTKLESGREGARQFVSSKEMAHGIHHPLEESRLPTLPLPSIEDTLDLYLTSARPFLNAMQFESVSHMARKFQKGCGRFLQEKLESRLKDPEIDNWQNELQRSGVWLRHRLPIHPFGTFYGIHLLTERAHNQGERAALITETAFAFKKKVEAGELEPDYLNGERLCSQSLNWLFNACREPHRDVDRVTKHELNDYIVVLRRGHAFKIVLGQGSQSVTHAKLRGAFNKVLDLTSGSIPSVATLTADERGSWEELRGIVRNISLRNQDSLDTIEGAAFVLCLDDRSPATPTERSNSLLLGDPGNRWSDKTLQFVVCANGVSGYLCEHSMLDAASLRQLNDWITTAIIESTARPEVQDDAAVDGHLSILEELDFDINNVLTDNIDRIRKDVITAFNPVEFTHFKLSSMGNNFLRKSKLPSKTAVQIIIQLASLLYYGVQHPSQETLTMMLFRSGRLDWMQTVSPAMFVFCETAFNENISLIQRSKMLREAAATHTRTMTRISRGRGFAAHLEALREVVQQETAVPEFFNDPTWEMMRVTGSKKLKTDASDGLRAQEAGFFMPDPEGVFVHYEIAEAECRFFVQSTKGRTEGFCQALEKAAKQITRLLKGT